LHHVVRVLFIDATSPTRQAKPRSICTRTTVVSSSSPGIAPVIKGEFWPIPVSQSKVPPVQGLRRNSMSGDCPLMLRFWPLHLAIFLQAPRSGDQNHRRRRQHPSCRPPPSRGSSPSWCRVEFLARRIPPLGSRRCTESAARQFRMPRLQKSNELSYSAAHAAIPQVFTSAGRIKSPRRVEISPLSSPRDGKSSQFIFTSRPQISRPHSPRFGASRSSFLISVGNNRASPVQPGTHRADWTFQRLRGPLRSSFFTFAKTTVSRTPAATTTPRSASRSPAALEFPPCAVVLFVCHYPNPLLFLPRCSFTSERNSLWSTSPDCLSPCFLARFHKERSPTGRV